MSLTGALDEETGKDSDYIWKQKEKLALPHHGDAQPNIGGYGLNHHS